MLHKKLNNKFMQLHLSKETAFWHTFMNLADSKKGELEKLEISFKKFINDPSYLPTIEKALEKEKNKEAHLALQGWKRFFEKNTIVEEECQKIAKHNIELEGKILEKRKNLTLGYLDPQTQEFTECGYAKLQLIRQNHKQEEYRKAAWQGLKEIGDFILDHGYIELIKERNKFAKKMGFSDYYDYKANLTEGISKKDLFTILQDLEVKTRQGLKTVFDRQKQQYGENALTGWNTIYYHQGDLTMETDPYLQFENALLYWGKTFTALGIDYQQANLTLDLIARSGKYENGFMHAPQPPYYEDGKTYPAVIQFTSNAVPGQLGGGMRGLKTFFHEGGHAAHFSNIVMPSPCFSQEYAPTSGAFAEVQSIFMDNLLGDPEWLLKYPRNRAGQPMSQNLIKKIVQNKQQSLPLTIRTLLIVPFVEKAIYELADNQCTAHHIKEIVLEEEKKMFLGNQAHRPTLCIPHLLKGESSAAYHSYVLAQMGVFQTRKYFLDKYGYIVDNPQIGSDLKSYYWQPGNSKTFFEFIKDLTMQPFNVDATAEAVNRSAKELEESIDQAFKRGKQGYEGEIILGFKDLKMIHGDEFISSIQRDGSFEKMAEKYAAWYHTLS
ncbi:MAG: M3 family metallopeptidase [Spirochaetes bacterium]|nr:M3 family metallopeptidase [Spirochaetota bacterium]